MYTSIGNKCSLFVRVTYIAFSSKIHNYNEFAKWTSAPYLGTFIAETYLCPPPKRTKVANDTKNQSTRIWIFLQKQRNISQQSNKDLQKTKFNLLCTLFEYSMLFSNNKNPFP